MENPSAYPLVWPAGWPRWKGQREWGLFKVSEGREYG